MARSVANERDSFVGRQTLGGGTGKYRNACGDVPHCLIRGSPVAASTPDTTEAKLDAACMPMRATNVLKGGGQCVRQTRLFHLLVKNCRGLGSADRFDELVEELRQEEWDMVMVNETWRTDKEEHWTTEDDHVFAGAGHDSGRKGVGILLHKRWCKNVIRFKPVSERICLLDVKILDLVYRFVSVYFPDSSYPDAEVQKVYDTLTEIRQDATKNKYKLVIAGDFNAKVGDDDENEMHPSCGRFGYGEQNSRGQWLLTWSSVNALKISNTMFRKQNHKLTTHINAHGSTSQLDYILVDNRTKSQLKDVEAGNIIDLGSDHFCIKAIMKFEQKFKSERKKGQRKAPSAKALWPPESIAAYVEKLDQLLETVRLEEAAHERYLKTQEALIKASVHAARQVQIVETREDSATSALRTLIDERKSLPKNEPERRCQVSKKIKKEIKRLKAEERAAKIDTILTKFSKLNTIKAIKSRKKIDLNVGMVDTDGTLKHDKKSIVEVFAKFYEQLYSSRTAKTSDTPLRKKDINTAVPEFNAKELQAGLRGLKFGKA